MRLGPLIALLLMFSSACAPIAGDACEDASDCGGSMYCERSLPGGYCTVASCVNRTCPGDGVCIRFDADTSYCMQPCATSKDCRADYTCVTEVGAHPFCNDARGAVPELESEPAAP